MLTEKDYKEPRIISVGVFLNELMVQLKDGRKISIPFEWFEKWGLKNLTIDDLKSYEIWHGEDIFFPSINEVLGLEVFIHGFYGDCDSLDRCQKSLSKRKFKGV